MIFTTYWFVLFAAACYLVSPYLGLSSYDIDPRISELWPPVIAR